MMDRNGQILDGLDLANTSGIEIGALDKPVVPPGTSGIFYVDHADTESLQTKYATDPNVDCGRIVEVGGVWGDQTLAEASSAVAPVDYIVASHVIEHVPDLIGWLDELEAALKPGGEIRLAIPDRRYSFDYLRRESIVTDVITAYVQHARRPQLREVIDFVYYETPVDCAKAWDGQLRSSELVRPARMKRALELGAEELRSDQYRDVHCWVFTPSSFCQLMAELAEAGLVRLRCSRLIDTQYYSLEFYATLERTDDQDDVVASWRAALEEREAPEQGAQSFENRHEVAALRNEVARLRGSRSWRVTAPLRAAAASARRIRDRSRRIRHVDR